MSLVFKVTLWGKGSSTWLSEVVPSSLFMLSLPIDKKLYLLEKSDDRAGFPIPVKAEFFQQTLQMPYLQVDASFLQDLENF